MLAKLFGSAKTAASFQVQIYLSHVEPAVHGGDVVEGIVTDITQERRAKRIYDFSQRLTILGQMAGGIAHDFNNYLGIIIGNVELAKISDATKYGKHLDSALTAARMAANLSRQLLNSAKPAQHDTNITDLDDQSRKLLELLRRTMPDVIQLQMGEHSQLANGVIPPHEFDQILMNLIINAKDALSPGGGTITVTAGRRADNDEHQAILSVLDDGPGIDPEIRDRLFEPFISTKPVGKGTGLGLSIVRDLVLENGGHIDFTSGREAGTEFIIALPAVD